MEMRHFYTEIAGRKIGDILFSSFIDILFNYCATFLLENNFKDMIHFIVFN